MQPQIINKPAFTVVGMRIQAKVMSSEIPQLWQQFGPRIDEVQAIAEPHVSYGLMDNLDMVRNQLDYMAGVSVTETTNLPAGMTAWEVPATTYAVFETSISTIGDTFGYIHNTWLPTAGYRQLADPYFERYGETFDPGDPNSKLEIYIPVEKKAA